MKDDKKTRSGSAVLTALNRLSLAVRGSWSLYLAIACLTVWHTQAVSAQEAPDVAVVPSDTPCAFFWRVEVVPPCYLFGTIHRRDERVATPSRLVEWCLGTCDVLCQELEFTGEQREKFRRAMMYDGKEPLHERLPTDVKDLLADFLGGEARLSGLPNQQVWSLALAIIKEEGHEDSKTFLDDWLKTRARVWQMSLEGLEQVDEQIAALSDYSPEEQLQMVRGVLEYFAALKRDGRNYGNEMVEAYRSGNPEELRRFREQSPMTMSNEVLRGKVYKQMFGDRDRRLAERIKERVERAGYEKKRVFFAIGAGHVVGAGSVIEHLEAAGLVLRRVDLGTQFSLDDMDTLAMRMRRDGDVAVQSSAEHQAK